MEETILLMKNIHKIYEINNLPALKGANLTVKRGRIHALIGENGAGKTTLMKILCGIESKNDGKIFVQGEEVNITNPRQAFNRGIGMVHQHFQLIDNFLTWENIVLGVEKTKRGFVDKKTIKEELCQLLRSSGLPLPLENKTKYLSVGEKQRVEILKILYRMANIIILDEPTSVLTEQETEELFKTLRMLKEQGKTIIFISHKLKEVKEICDEITILRKGETVAEGNIKDFSLDQISYLMVGEKIAEGIPKYKKISTMIKEKTENLLEIEDVSVINRDHTQKLKKVNLCLRKGEIVGIAGVAGNGQFELSEAIMGLLRVQKGHIRLIGKDITTFSTRQRREIGLSYVPEDRIKEGVSVSSTILENLLSTKYYQKDFSTKGWIKFEFASSFCKELVEKFSIKASSLREQVGMLSGGNIQKVILAREFSSQPNVLIVSEPTWGLDIRTTHSVYSLLSEMREKNIGILLISGNLDEILELSDRILVIYQGEIVASFVNSDSLTKTEIGEYMLGLHSHSEREAKREEEEDERIS